MEKIKKEREEARALQQAEADAEGDAAVQSANPLLNNGGAAGVAGAAASGSVKRRWDDDVVFRNQTAGEERKVRKRFINDTVRNDFHRRFLKKYVQ